MDKKPKLLVVSNHFYPENFRINDLVLSLQNTLYDVKVVTQTPNYGIGHFPKGYSWFKKTNERTTNNLNVTRLPVIPRGKNKQFLFINYLSYYLSGLFYSWWTREKVDLVFTYATSPLLVAMIGNRIAKKNKVPTVLYLLDLWPDNFFLMHDFKSEKMKKLWIAICSKIYQDVDMILISSKGFENSLIDYGVDSRKIVYWPQFAEDTYKNKQLELKNPTFKPFDSDKLNITFTGNIGFAQGLDKFIDVGLLVKEKRLPVIFNFVGTGSYHSVLKNLISENNLQDYFNFTGHLPIDQMPVVLSQSDFALHSFVNEPAFHKTLPAKLQSYLAFGIPVMVSASGESSRIINEAQCGFASDSDDVQGFFANIERALDLEETQKLEMGDNAKQFYKENFNKDYLINKLNHIFENLYDNNKNK